MNERVEKRALQMLIFETGGLQLTSAPHVDLRFRQSRQSRKSDRCEYKDF
jgi:hypothetical protein